LLVAGSIFWPSPTGAARGATREPDPVLTADARAAGHVYRVRSEQAGGSSGSAVPHRAGRKEVTEGMKAFLRRLRFSPTLVAVLVFVLGSPRKIPKP
jgi:hypothetical protein